MTIYACPLSRIAAPLRLLLIDIKACRLSAQITWRTGVECVRPFNVREINMNTGNKNQTGNKGAGSGDNKQSGGKGSGGPRDQPADTSRQGQKGDDNKQSGTKGSKGGK
jgi:hypothetical protein